MKTMIISSNCSSGVKTTFTLGLMKALMNRKYDIQGFKVGPDYIDTGFHTEITGKASRNLDIHLMGEKGVKAAFLRGKGDLAIVEGVMGLYDGKGLDTEGSTYNISKILDNAPILLVITPKAQSVTLCAEINGIKDFRNANIVGIVLNNISESYYEILKAAIEKNCDTKVFGYIPKNEDIKLESRHLGLIQSVEVENLKNRIDICAELVEKYIDLDGLIECFKDSSMFQDEFHLKSENKRIAVAYDEAFRFYYKENLELLEELGEVIYFSPLKDKELPENIDFLYLGGGYPEVFKDSLRENKTMLLSIKNALEKGLRCYGECGGLMYLTEKIDDVPMVGFFSGESEMTKTLNRFGYATIYVDGININCHEFHRSKTISQEKAIYRVEKVGYLGESKVWTCGFKKFNTLAGYPHVHFFGNMDFLNYIINGKEGN